MVAFSQEKTVNDNDDEYGMAYRYEEFPGDLYPSYMVSVL